MTLEDFFTLTEMKDGLTAPARIEELVSVMKNEKDSSVKNLGDATRQWATVASTIAATENKECLDLFVRQDGLWFIDRWLKHAQTFATEGSDCFVEEAISALLQAVEKLHVDNERLTSSGICGTVKSLLSYRNSRVQDRARTLLDNWKAKDAAAFLSTVAEKAAVYGDSALNNEHAKSQTAADDALQIRCLDDHKSKCAEREMIKISNVHDSSQLTSDHADSKDGCPDTIATPVKLKCGEGDISVIEDVCSSDRKLDPQSPSDPKQVTVEVISEALKSEPVPDVKDDRIESVRDRLGKVEVSSASDFVNVSSKNNSLGSKEADVKPDPDANDAKDDLTIEIASSKDTNQLVGESRNGMNDSVSLEQKGLDQGCSAVQETKDQGTTISRMEDVGRYGEAKKRHKSKKKYFGNTCEFTRLTKSSKNTDFIRQTGMDLEDGTVDALDFARLVAKEIEREVVGYDEQSGSFFEDDERISRGSSRQLDSPESINGGEEQLTNGQADGLPTVENVTHEASERELLTNSVNQDTKMENHIEDMESSQVTGALQELEANTEKNICEFDLNQELSSEDIYHQIDTVSNPVSVFASRVTAPGMPAGSSQFEKTLSCGGTSSGSRQRLDLVDIDLNVAEDGDDKIIKPVSGKQMAMLPGLLSGESSVELSPMRSDKLKFDLNQIGEDGDLPVSDWKMDGRILGQPQNRRRSPSPASSSSCLQPSMRNFDLNDNPSSCNSAVDHQPFLGESSSHKISSYMGPPDDSVISIMGTKIKKNTSQTLTPFPNGRASEPVMDASLLRGAFVGLGPSVPYAQSVYGYNGLAMGPVVPFPPGPTYGSGGPIPYLFVSRGAPVMPHMIGSTPSVASSYCQPSLVMNMVGPGSNGVGALRPNLDLNSGFAVEGGNRDPAFFRPLLIPGHGRPLDEQLRDNLRSFNTGSSGGKRKEPETGWELYPTNYKHHQPPHL